MFARLARPSTRASQRAKQCNLARSSSLQPTLEEPSFEGQFWLANTRRHCLLQLIRITFWAPLWPVNHVEESRLEESARECSPVEGKKSATRRPKRQEACSGRILLGPKLYWPAIIFSSLAQRSFARKWKWKWK